MPKKKSSQQGYGGFILTFEPGRAAWLADHLYPDMRAMKLSESFSSRDWEMEQRELMFLMFHSEQPLSIGALVLLERSEEHTYELTSLMRNSYAVFCLTK